MKRKFEPENKKITTSQQQRKSKKEFDERWKKIIQKERDTERNFEKERTRDERKSGGTTVGMKSQVKNPKTTKKHKGSSEENGGKGKIGAESGRNGLGMKQNERKKLNLKPNCLDLTLLGCNNSETDRQTTEPSSQRRLVCQEPVEVMRMKGNWTKIKEIRGQIN